MDRLRTKYGFEGYSPSPIANPSKMNCIWVMVVNPDFVQSLTMSRVCPIAVQYKISFSKALNVNPEHFFQVQRMSRNSPIRKSAIVSTLLDRGWTSSSFACPTSVQRLGSLTGLRQSFDQTWTATGQALYMTSFWTDLGQALDKLWTEVGFSVQSPSNQPKSTSTQIPSVRIRPRNEENSYFESTLRYIYLYTKLHSAVVIWI